MAKPEWGLKRMCQSCGAKFYDLQRTPIICPKCAVEFDPESVLRSRRGRSSATPEKATVKAAASEEPSAKEAPAAEADAAAASDASDDDDDDNSLIESTDDLDGDGADMPNVSDDGEEEDN